MVERITYEQFHNAAGVEDWHSAGLGVAASYQTGSFARGVEFVVAIGKVADEADHHPDVDLRFGSVTLHLVTHFVNSLTPRDIALARSISVIARELSLPLAVP